MEEEKVDELIVGDVTLRTMNIVGTLHVTSIVMNTTTCMVTR